MLAPLALLAVGAVLAFILIGGRDGNDRIDPETQRVADAAGRTAQRLAQALTGARPADAASMAALRTVALNAAEDFHETRIDLRALMLERSQPSAGQRDLQDALSADEALARALANPRPAVAALETLSADAADATRDATALGLPVVETAPFVAAVRARSRARAATARRRARKKAAAAKAGTSVRFIQHIGLGYQAQIPTGSEWSAPADSQPTPGELFRTSVRGPEGMFLIIDYTPFEPARFGGGYQSRRSVGQTAFGSATQYVFHGGRLPECQRSRCVDYIINDPGSGAGFGVLAGGPDFALAQEIARTVMESLTAAPG